MLGLQFLSDKITQLWGITSDTKELLEVMKESKDSCNSALEALDNMITGDKIRSNLLVLRKQCKKFIPMFNDIVQPYYAQVQ